MRGKFITVEGLDGAGKSTQLEWLHRHLEKQGIHVRVTREPGGTPLGEALRALLLDVKQRLHPETEVMLMFAARREHLERVIAPSLADGVWVLCDRFTDSSFAYQGGGGGVAWEKIEALERWVQGSLTPDITLYFDVSPAIGRARAGAIKAPDRYEQEQSAFHERVREAYLRRARESRGRIQVIDANPDCQTVQRDLERVVAPLLAACRPLSAPRAR